MVSSVGIFWEAPQVGELETSPQFSAPEEALRRIFGTEKPHPQRLEGFTYLRFHLC